MQSFEWVTEEYCSNCLIEALKHKLKDWKSVKVYFIPIDIAGKQNFHFMWYDGTASYDFSDYDDEVDHNIFHYLYYAGRVRKFPADFAAKYQGYRRQRVKSWLKNKHQHKGE